MFLCRIVCVGQNRNPINVKVTSLFPSRENEQPMKAVPTTSLAYHFMISIMTMIWNESEE
jgi:hypothetical protein